MKFSASDKPSFLGQLTIAQFLKEYWQKKPLLVRQAFNPADYPIHAEEILNFAQNEQIESRLVSQQKQRWQMQHGPFLETQGNPLPPLSQKNWTVLVQGLNLHHPPAHRLLQAFRFLPDARLDDLMVSYASKGGGVGPHFDSYDVFLLQTHGSRRWRISDQTDLSLQEGLPLKILKNFTHQEEWVLAPGDLLYLPPKYAHEGVALSDACMTASVGFRAPSFQELGYTFLAYVAEELELPGQISDPNLGFQKNPAELPENMVAQVIKKFQQIKWNEQTIKQFLGEYLSEPKATTFFSSPNKNISETRFRQLLLSRGCKLAPQTRIFYDKRNIYINGESMQATKDERKLLVLLANQQYLSPDNLAKVTPSEELLDMWLNWFDDGWMVLA